VLASMLFAPHRNEWGLRRSYDWAATGHYFPVFIVDSRESVHDWRSDFYYPNPVLWGQLAGQSIFAGVLAAVLVNLRKPARSKSADAQSTKAKRQTQGNGAAAASCGSVEKLK